MILGIDVSKAKLDTALLLPGKRKWYDARVDNTQKGFEKLVAFCERKSGESMTQILVVMEATGVYHEAAAEAFHDAGCRVIIANPKRVRDFAKGLGLLSKNDTIDARALARYGEVGGAQLWQPPAPEIRELRALSARLTAVEQDLRREENRWEKAQIATTPMIVRDSLKRSIETLRAERKRLLKAIEDHYNQHPGLKAERLLLQTIPAVGKVSSNHLLCVLRGRDFRNARQAAALVGLVPLEYTSGSSVRGKSRLSKQGNPKLRAVLYMASVSALQHNPALKEIYTRLREKGKPALSALGALMRHLVHIAFGVLKHQKPYNPALVSRIS